MGHQFTESMRSGWYKNMMYHYESKPCSIRVAQSKSTLTGYGAVRYPYEIVLS